MKTVLLFGVSKTPDDMIREVFNITGVGPVKLLKQHIQMLQASFSGDDQQKTILNNFLDSEWMKNFYRSISCKQDQTVIALSNQLKNNIARYTMLFSSKTKVNVKTTDINEDVELEQKISHLPMLSIFPQFQPMLRIFPRLQLENSLWSKYMTKQSNDYTGAGVCVTKFKLG